MNDTSIMPTTLNIDYETIFDALPAAYIVFAANDPDFTVVAENGEHARIALVEKGAVIGKPLLEAFPDTSEKYVQTGTSDLLESIRSVIRTGSPDYMPVLHYDLQNSDGEWETKYWQVSHHPIYSADKKVVMVYQATREITDEITTDEKLQHVQEQFELAAESGLISVWRWDIKQQKIYADANLCRLFGLSASEGERGLELERFIMSIHPDDRQRVQDDIERALSSKEPYEAEYRTLTPAGTQYVIARGVVEVDESGEPESFPGVIVDITDRKRIELELQESEERLRFMADSMPQLVWITRADGYHEYYNQRWYDYTGTIPGSTDGEGWNDLFHEADRPRAWKLWRQSLKTGEPYEIEYRLYHAPSTSYRWVIGRAMPFRDSSGKIVKWYGTCTDIDDQKRDVALQTLLARTLSELATDHPVDEKFQVICDAAVVEMADVAIVDMFDAGEFGDTYVASRMPEYAEAMRTFRKKMPMSLDDRSLTSDAVKQGKSFYYPTVTRDGIRRHYDGERRLDMMMNLKPKSIIVVPIETSHSQQGAVTLISTEGGRTFNEHDLDIAKDIAIRMSLYLMNEKLQSGLLAELAKRKELEQSLRDERDKLEARVKERTIELEKTNVDLSRSNRELEDFAYVASHDLQEPLRKIQAFGDLLQEEYASSLGEGADYLMRMQSAASRMSTLINDLLTFSRVTTKKSPKTHVDLSTIIEGVIGDLENRINRTGAKLQVGRLPEVYADATQMRQLFQNLIANALKFHREGIPPQVTITSKLHTDKTTGKSFDEIRIKDNGVGFDEKYLDRIFAVFQRLHGRDTFEGTGIGLAVCRKIVERHNGTITAKSKPGGGATFIIRLPRREKKGV